MSCRPSLRSGRTRLAPRVVQAATAEGSASDEAEPSEENRRADERGRNYGSRSARRRTAAALTQLSRPSLRSGRTRFARTIGSRSARRRTAAALTHLSRPSHRSGRTRFAPDNRFSLGTPPHCGGTHATLPALAPLGPDSLRSRQSVLARHAAALRRHSRNSPGPRTARAGLASLQTIGSRSARRRTAAALTQLSRPSHRSGRTRFASDNRFSLGTPPHCGGTHATLPALAPLGPDSLRFRQSVLARHAAALRRHSRNSPGPRTARAGLASLQTIGSRSARRRTAAALTQLSRPSHRSGRTRFASDNRFSL